ncbi:MAG: DUF4956 domain-containing protein [Oscillospiraceae bacterium]|nr:DUF4956 domain-containing protein [Oscillospiraceae bacterium]
MFGSIYSTVVTPAQFFVMAAAALASGFLYSWILSFRVRSSKRFFIVSTLIPFIVGAVITFVNGNIGSGVAIGGVFGMARFRSAQGSADEITSILVAMGAGIAFGMGYIAYGIIILLGMAALYLLLSQTAAFEHESTSAEKMLHITIPETLEYSGAFDDLFSRYLKKAESAGVKTAGMGSLFRLSYRIQMKDPSEEKAFIDDLRVRNGNLEISILPYTEQITQL